MREERYAHVADVPREVASALCRDILPAGPRRPSGQDYLVLEQLDRLSGGELAQVLIRQGSAGLALTTCPECGPHGAFRHRDGCPLERAYAIATAAAPRVDGRVVARYLHGLIDRFAVPKSNMARELLWILTGMPQSAADEADHEAHYLRRLLAGDRVAPPSPPYPPPRPAAPPRPCDVPEVEGCTERAAEALAITRWCAGIVLVVAIAAGAWRAWAWLSGGAA